MTQRMTLKQFKGGLFPAGKNAKPAPLEPKEGNISKSIQDYLNRRGIYNDRINSGQLEVVTTSQGKNGPKEYRRWIRLAKKGTPDRFAIIPPSMDRLKRGGQIVFIEVKMRGKKPSPEQLERHEELRRSGATVIIADSLDSFIAQFNELIA